MGQPSDANVKRGILKAASNAIHRDPSGEGSTPAILARIIYLEQEAGLESPEGEEAQTIAQQLQDTDDKKSADAKAAAAAATSN